MSDELDQAINRTIGFLLGLSDGLEVIAPDKSERCRAFADLLDKARNVADPTP